MLFMSNRHLGLILMSLCSNLGLSRPTDEHTQVHVQWVIALQTSVLNVIASRLCLQKSLMKASPQALSSAQHVGGNRPTIFPMALSGVRENLQPREGRGELGWFPSYPILNRLLILHKVGSPQRLGSQMRTLLWIYLSYLV